MKIKFLMLVSIFLIVGIFFVSAENFDDEKRVVIREDALNAISESQEIIQVMFDNNFSIVYVSDLLIEAERVFKQAEYAEILRGDFTNDKVYEAREALKLVNWKEIDYWDVLNYTDEIKFREKKAFLLMDEIFIQENELNPEQGSLYSSRFSDFSLEDVSLETKQILEEAKIAFQEDRYEDSENLIKEFRTALEREKVEASILVGVKNSAKNFFQRYWIYILIVLILLLVMSYLTYKKFEKKMTIKKIKKIKTEKEVLKKLIRKVQEDRFKKNIISGLVYNIRLNKYNERKQEIEQELPVLENRLVKLKNKK